MAAPVGAITNGQPDEHRTSVSCSSTTRMTWTRASTIRAAGSTSSGTPRTMVVLTAGHCTFGTGKYGEVHPARRVRRQRRLAELRRGAGLRRHELSSGETPRLGRETASDTRTGSRGSSPSPVGTALHPTDLQRCRVLPRGRGRRGPRRRHVCARQGAAAGRLPRPVHRQGQGQDGVQLPLGYGLLLPIGAPGRADTPHEERAGDFNAKGVYEIDRTSLDRLLQQRDASPGRHLLRRLGRPVLQGWDRPAGRRQLLRGSAAAAPAAAGAYRRTSRTMSSWAEMASRQLIRASTD